MKLSSSFWKIVLMINFPSFEKNMKLPDLPAVEPALWACLMFLSGESDCKMISGVIPSCSLSL